jgi:DNA-binding beta-propeller fold protein YncE
LARLPVSIRPSRYCVSGDGGQVFITGADREGQLVIFSPYQNQVDQTLYAGRALFGMAVAPVRNLLFLSNPAAGDVAILDIDTRRPAGSIRTGGSPREILIAPSADPSAPEEYAFVVDGDSGDVSVIHIPTVLHKSGDAFIAEPPKPVFAVFHGGALPQSAVIVPYSV